jgi:hypothetical protein
VVFEEIKHGLVCVVGELETLVTLHISQSFEQAGGAANRMGWLLGVRPFSNRINYLT